MLKCYKLLQLVAFHVMHEGKIKSGNRVMSDEHFEHPRFYMFKLEV